MFSGSTSGEKLDPVRSADAQDTAISIAFVRVFLGVFPGKFTEDRTRLPVLTNGERELTDSDKCLPRAGRGEPHIRSSLFFLR